MLRDMIFKRHLFSPEKKVHKARMKQNLPVLPTSKFGMLQQIAAARNQTGSTFPKWILKKNSDILT